MNLIRKKYILLMVLIAVGDGVLSADQNSLDAYTQTSLCKMQNNNDCCQQSSYCEDAFGRFFIRGDLLYWKPHVSGIELDFGTAYIDQVTTDGTQVTRTEEFDADPHFKWNCGYRVAAGYQFVRSNWEIDAYWTSFQGTSSRDSTEDVDTINTGKYKVRLNQLDVDLAYNLPLCPSFILKPFVGVRGARIHQSLNAQLTTDITFSPTSLATETRILDDSQKFCGIGPILGLEGGWNLGCGFGVYGSAIGGVLYGIDKVHFNDTDIFTAPISKQIFSLNNRNIHEFNCTLDLAIGLSWQTCVYDGFQLTLKLDFEHHEYFNQNKFSATRGDLCFDGGVFSISIDM